MIYPGFEVAKAACAADATAEGVFLHQVRNRADYCTPRPLHHLLRLPHGVSLRRGSAHSGSPFTTKSWARSTPPAGRTPSCSLCVAEILSTSSFRRPTRKLVRYMAVCLFLFIYPLGLPFETVCNSCVAHHLPPWFSEWRCSATRPAILKACGCKERHVLCSTRALGHKRALSVLPLSRRYLPR